MRRNLKPALWSALVTVVAFVAIYGLNVTLQREADREAALRHEKYADRAAAIVTERTDLVLSTLRDVAVVVRRAKAAGISATAEFHAYLDGTEVLTEHPVLSAIAFMQHATGDELEALVSHYNADPQRAALGYPPIEIKDLADLPYHAILVMLSPLAGGEAELGADILSRPRRAIFDRVMASGEMRVSKVFDLFNGDRGAAFFYPVSGADDDARFIGVMAVVLNTVTFLQGLELTLAPLGLDIEIHDLGYLSEDLATPSPETLLAAAGGRAPADLGVDDLIASSPTAITREIEVAGRVWSLAMEPLVPRASVWAPDRFTMLGAMVALLAGALAFRISQSAEELSRQVALRTSRLRDLAETLRRERSGAEHAASHDELTGLLNRRGLRMAFREAGCPAREGGHVALLAVDLDRFKQINDTAGHQAGDALLEAAARALRAIAPQGALVARFGGDEFAVVMAGQVEDARRVAERFIAWARKPQLIGGIVLRSSASVGAAIGESEGCDLDRLFANADIALYAAKDAGRDRLGLFDQELRRKAVATKSLADDLKRALDADEFEPFFQTQHDAADHALKGVETLVRWRHPQRGVLTPAAFLDVAESAGLLHEIDQRVMQRAAAAVAAMEAQGLAVPKLSVNVSLRRLTDPRLTTSVEALPRLGATLCFEVVEAIFLDEVEEPTVWQLDALREIGVELELDDFGSGRASILALMRLAPERLKIDKGLIAPLSHSPGQERLLSSIVEMGRALDIGVTAEGVETRAQADLLRRIGVDTLQGFCFSKPMAAADLTTFLARRPAGGAPGGAAVNRCAGAR